MNFNEQPTEIAAANSPIMYQFYDGNYGQPKFYYEVKIYAWQGTNTIPGTPVATIERYPDQYGNGRGWIDAHKIAEQYINSDSFDASTAQPTIGGGAAWVAVKVQGKYEDGSGNPLTTTQITSNVVLATAGFTYTSEGFNANLSGPVLTTKSKFEIPLGVSSYYVWYEADDVTGITIGSTTYTPATVTQSSNKVQGVDLIDLYETEGATGDTTVTFTTSGDDVVYTIQRPCENRYGHILIHFINKFGVYDSYVFNALHKTQVEFTGESYEKPQYAQEDLTRAWTYGVQQTTPFLKQSKEKYTLNTNWIPEGDNDVMQEMFMSDNILIDDDYLKSARVTSTSFQRKTRTNDKLIQYTIELEVNHGLVNKIVR